MQLVHDMWCHPGNDKMEQIYKARRGRGFPRGFITQLRKFHCATCAVSKPTRRYRRSTRVKVAADAVVAAKAPHAFMGMTKMGQAAIFETRGNQDVHIILRGGKAPNYSAADVDAACKALEASGIAPQVMVDVSHANSSKQHAKQIEVAHDVAAQVAGGDRRIMGLMIESHLNEGRQDLKQGQPLAHGVSITDACISFAQTVPVLDALAQAVQKRRSGA